MIESGTASGVTRPKCQTAIGVVTSHTAIVVVRSARAVSRHHGPSRSGASTEPYQRSCSRGAQWARAMTAPKVSWNPGRKHSSGSAATITSAAAPRRLEAFHRRERISPALAPSAQQADRVTEACGSTRATYPAMRRKEIPSPSLGGARHADASSVMDPASTARLKPEMAMRCASPAWVNRRSISPLPRASRPRSIVCRRPHASASHQGGMTR